MTERRRVVMRPAWHHLLFLHWEVEPASLARTLPPGLELDLFEDRAFIGLVPFTMTAVRPHGLPHMPDLRRWHEDFHEINVRTYVRHRKFGPGVWFYSLDAASAPAVCAARLWFKLPYFFAAMRLEAHHEAGGLIFDYASQRRWPPPIPSGCEISYSPTGIPAPATPGTLEHFLVERYLLYSQAQGQLFAGRVHHKPYPIQHARVHTLHENLIANAGIARPNSTPLAHYARKVQVDILGLQRVT